MAVRSRASPSISLRERPSLSFKETRENKAIRDGEGERILPVRRDLTLLPRSNVRLFFPNPFYPSRKMSNSLSLSLSLEYANRKRLV